LGPPVVAGLLRRSEYPRETSRLPPNSGKASPAKALEEEIQKAQDSALMIACAGRLNSDGRVSINQRLRTVFAPGV
jgi:hypothetical protein